MRVSVVGAGYVGLVSGVCLAEAGHQVACVEIDPAKVAQIVGGVPPIYEDGLAELLQRNLGRRFTVTGDLHGAVLNSEVTLIAVGTPFDGARIDLSYVREAARAIGAALRGKQGYHVVVVKSTVVPGTTEKEVLPLLEQASGKVAGGGFGLGMNPEFLTEGQAIRDFMAPDRIVLGAIDSRSMGGLDELYAFLDNVPKIRTNPSTAEMIKYTSNALLATAISFSNEIANICAALGDVDVVEVMDGVHASSYLTVTSAEGKREKAPITSFLQAGCGFGGSCLPKDVKALIAHGEDVGVAMPLLRSVIAVNEARPRQILRTLEKHFPSLSGLRVAVLGLAFKPDTSDVRESPAFPVIRLLRDGGASVKAYDPVAVDEARKVLGTEVVYAESLMDCLEDVDAVVLLTRWKQFDAVPGILSALKSPPLLLDGRRQLDKRAVARYAGIGV
ncbi:MAG TPA: UDP-glucose/GDP-mannose dehydrogenase family protein [Candidatus Limnocylindria bacterium]|jgi:UDPglucose 6-dehydrogenase/GDP-mannose 6-dehydrogenase|nr:UDP-glucose/GDP-mannose dehydrogenase family protein [Candidatus Limnocylindria bacterium]